MTNKEQYEFRYWRRPVKSLMGVCVVCRSSRDGTIMDRQLRGHLRTLDVAQGTVRAVRRAHFARMRLARQEAGLRYSRMLYDPDLLMEDEQVFIRAVRAVPRVFGSRRLSDSV